MEPAPALEEEDSSAGAAWESRQQSQFSSIRFATGPLVVVVASLDELSVVATSPDAMLPVEPASSVDPDELSLNGATWAGCSTRKQLYPQVSHSC
jgi:hypothetical protein